MDDLTTTTTTAAGAPTPASTLTGSDGDVPAGARSTRPDPDQLIDDELLVEEISIDGMCGVY